MNTLKLVAWMAVAVAMLAGPLYAAGPGKGEGSEFEFGGPGDGKGKFQRLTDMVIGPSGDVYALDGGEWDRKTNAIVGNLLVQKFDKTGKFVSQISIRDDSLGEKCEPVHLAVDSRGHVFITVPRANLVREFAADGARVKDYAVPGAYAVTVRQVGGKEEAVVIGRPGKRMEEPATEAILIGPAGETQPLRLERPVSGATDLAVDRAGNLYVLADVNQIYKFAPDGKWLLVIGGGTKLRLEDGSELIHSIALDSKDHLYALTWGNPGYITRFDPEFKTVTRRHGEFAWADPWGIHSSLTILALDATDRLWVGATGLNDGQTRGHFRPCILRTEAGFVDVANRKVITGPTTLLGLNLDIEVKRPYNVAYALEPVQADFVVKAGVRRIGEADVTWHAYDWLKNEAGKGTFHLALKDGEESRQTVAFTPPRFGWYSLQFQVSHKGGRLTGLAAHVGVTPPFEGMPVLEAGQSPGGWEDPLRQAFAGLMLMRVHPDPKNLDKIEAAVEGCHKYGLTLVAQFQDAKHCTPEFVREVVTRFKGRIRYWEIMNEPNFTFKPPEYAALVKQLYPVIKSIDPQAQVLAPAVCGVQLPWHEEFFKAAGADCYDIISIHDYEGHESIDPFHWRWKIAELHKLMAAYGAAGKPVWQTERAIGGIRGQSFLGVCQAVRVTLQRDLLETLGIPSEHNLHYYLNEGGYSAVPTYLWSSAGPHPGALATRTRFAMTRGRTYAGVLDFGPTGNKFLMGLRYKGDDGQTIVLQNLGTLDMPLDLTVTGGQAVTVVDAFGNASKVQAAGGVVRVTVSSFPVYLRLTKGQEVAPPRMDFGRNLASQARFTYSAPSRGAFTLLNDGVMQTVHDGPPFGGTNGASIWQGDLPALPQTLEIAFDQPQTVSRAVLFGIRADNAFCALLDFDLEYHDGKGWVALQKVRTPLPESDEVQTPLCKAMSWDRDVNFHVCQFKPVTAQRLRVVVRRTTFGFIADEAARRFQSGDLQGRLMLREVEVYGP